MKRLCAVFGLMVLASPGAWAESDEVMARNLHAACAGEGDGQLAFCDGYMRGIADAGVKDSRCYDMTAELPSLWYAVKTAFMDYMEAHPAARGVPDQPAARVIADAVVAAYPCRDKGE